MASINKRASSEQFEMMLEFLEKNAGLNALLDTEAWNNLAKQLNTDESGVEKSVEKWRKTLRDWKQYVKKKFSKKEYLTPMEERLMNLISGESYLETTQSSLDSVSIVEPSCSYKRELQFEEDTSDALLNPKNKLGRNCMNGSQNKHKKQKVSKEEQQIQARLLEAEEQKADALQRMAVSFESIAATLELLCHSLFQTS